MSPNFRSNMSPHDEPPNVNAKNRLDAVLLGALSATQFSLLLVLSVVILLSLKGDIPDSSVRTHSRRVSFQTGESLSNSTPSPSLLTLLDMVVRAFETHGITYWLMPGLNLLPLSSEESIGRVLGKISPWHEGIDLGVFQSDLMNVIEAQTKLQEYGIVAVESYFGLRIFSEVGHEDSRYDFRRPFIDVVYFDEEEGHIVSGCCECVPNTVGACTKKTCDCMFCVAEIDDVFPLAKVKIDGVQSVLKAPRRTETLMLHDTSCSVHPALRTLLERGDVAHARCER